MTDGERELRQALADHGRELEAMTGEARSEVNVRVRRMAIDDEVLFRSEERAPGACSVSLMVAPSSDAKPVK